MERKELLYNGKAKQIFATEDNHRIIMSFKDDSTAYYGVQKISIKNKGILNNKISEIVFKEMEKSGIKTHFIKRIDERSQLCIKTEAIPLEFIVRNIIAGSLARRLNVEEGTIPRNIIYEICLKNDILRDPLINSHHAVALNLVTFEELKTIQNICTRINDVLIRIFNNVEISVIDFKVEFGRDDQGNLLLIDEISPDTARFWDTKNKQKLDNNRFNLDVSKMEEAYKEVLKRLTNANKMG